MSTKNFYNPPLGGNPLPPVLPAQTASVRKHSALTCHQFGVCQAASECGDVCQRDLLLKPGLAGGLGGGSFAFAPGTIEPPPPAVGAGRIVKAVGLLLCTSALLGFVVGYVVGWVPL